MASSPPKNHWWHVPLYLDVHGLTTRLLHAQDGIGLRDPLRLRQPPAGGRDGGGATESFALADGLSVAAFDEQLHAALAGLGVDVADPREAVRRADDDAVRGRSRARLIRPAAVERFWRVLDWTAPRSSRSSPAGSAASEPRAPVLALVRPGADPVRRPPRAADARRRSRHAGGLCGRGRLLRLLGG